MALANAVREQLKSLVRLSKLLLADAFDVYAARRVLAQLQAAATRCGGIGSR